jgi:acyl carrier protein
MEEHSQQLLNRIIEVCRRSVPAGVVLDGGTSLIRDLGLDSFQALELVSEIESDFGIRIPSESLPEIDSLDDVARLVGLALREGKAQ